MKHVFLVIIFCASFRLLGQIIEFKPVFRNQSLELNKKYVFQNDTVEIETLKFYVSNVRFYNKGKLVDTADKKYLLVDFEKPNSLTVKHRNKKFNSIKFYVGIDSLINVAGVLSGDLDPTKGMYWAWHSGYINFKLEGKSKKCQTRKNKFQFHIGGYEFPFNTLQEKEFNTNNKDVVIEIALDEFFTQIDLSKQYEVMSPNQQAVEISKLFSNSFHLAK